MPTTTGGRGSWAPQPERPGATASEGRARFRVKGPRGNAQFRFRSSIPAARQGTAESAAAFELNFPGRARAEPQPEADSDQATRVLCFRTSGMPVAVVTRRGRGGGLRWQWNNGTTRSKSAGMQSAISSTVHSGPLEKSGAPFFHVSFDTQMECVSRAEYPSCKVVQPGCTQGRPRAVWAVRSSKSLPQILHACPATSSYSIAPYAIRKKPPSPQRTPLHHTGQALASPNRWHRGRAELLQAPLARTP